MIEQMRQVTVTWQVEPDASAVRDVVLMARCNHYTASLERAAYREDMYKLMREYKAIYRNAYNVEMALSQAEAFGKKWETKHLMNNLTARFRKVAWGKLHWSGHESILQDDVCIVADGSEIIHYKSLDAFIEDLEEWEMWEAVVAEGMGEQS